MVFFLVDTCLSQPHETILKRYAIVKDDSKINVTIPPELEEEKEFDLFLTDITPDEKLNDLILIIDISGEGVYDGSIRGKYFDIKYGDTNFHPFTIASINRQLNYIRFYIKITARDDSWTNSFISVLKAETNWDNIRINQSTESTGDSKEDEGVQLIEMTPWSISSKQGILGDEDEQTFNFFDKEHHFDLTINDDTSAAHDVFKGYDEFLGLVSVEYPVELKGPLNSPIKSCLSLPERGEVQRLMYVLITGGSGVTVATSFIQDIFDSAINDNANCKFQVTFAFSTRNRKLLALIYQQLKNLKQFQAENVDLTALLYHTRGGALKFTEERDEFEEQFHVIPGRMNVQYLLQEAGARVIADTQTFGKKETVNIICCSEALSHSTHIAVNNLNLTQKENLHFEFDYEVF